MLRTSLCDLVGIEVPVVQAGMSVYTSPELVAAVSDAGALGSLGAFQRPVDQLERDLASLRDLTERAFAVNHVVTDFDEAAFALTLEAAPAVVSFALDDPGELVERVHDVGSLVMHQVTTVSQAQRAVEAGVDIVVAQGTEAGGYGGSVAALALIPQVVDAVQPVPVVAAGGIADGRGVAAALVLGAAGVNLGTRFLASREAAIGDGWKNAITAGASEDFVQFDFFNVLNPVPGALGYGTRLRARRSEFTDKWEPRLAEIDRDRDQVITELVDAMGVAVAGQSSGLIHEVASAADIVRALVTEAEAALLESSKLLG